MLCKPNTPVHVFYVPPLGRDRYKDHQTYGRWLLSQGSGAATTGRTELFCHMVAIVSYEQDYACQASLHYARRGRLSGKGLKSFKTHPAVKYTLSSIRSWQIFIYCRNKWVTLEYLANLSLLKPFESKCVILTNQKRSPWPVFCTSLGGVCMTK